jgi:glycosyltransferase involved in cell wall biosynthesis
MKVYVIRDGAFTLANGQPASDLINYDAFAKRYLTEFSEVVLVGRLFKKEDPAARPATGPGVTFLPLPGYHGPIGFLKNLPRIIATIARSIEPGAAYILRIPTTVPSLYSIALWLRRIPFAVEVAGDPRDGYSRQSLNNHPLAWLFRGLFVTLTRWQCRTAIASAYVTRDALQRHYPARNQLSAFSFTSIDLTPDSYSSGPRQFNASVASKPHIVLVGNMQKSAKGHDVLLKAMRRMKDRRYNPRLTIVGYGENMPTYAKMAKDLDLDVHFTGKLPNGAPIRQVLDAADIFVLPSRQEGLPRALLEAMARGLPAIATSVGGTPELLEGTCLVPPDDPDALAERIIAIISDITEMERLSARNLAVAKQYNVEQVTQARIAFFRLIKSVCQCEGMRQ